MRDAEIDSDLFEVGAFSERGLDFLFLLRRFLEGMGGEACRLLDGTGGEVWRRGLGGAIAELTEGSTVVSL